MPTCWNNVLRGTRYVFGKDNRHPVLEVPVDVAMEHPRSRVVGLDALSVWALRRANTGGRAMAYFEANGNVISSVPDVYGVAAYRVDVVGGNLTGATDDRERMLIHVLSGSLTNRK